jgi:acyl-CoA thioester hydrolase
MVKPVSSESKKAPHPPFGNEHRTTHRVRYADIDRMGVAYYANYLRWFEVGRSEMFRDLGFPYREVENRGIFMPVSEVYCKFMAGAPYDMELTIETKLDPTIRGGMKFDYRIYADDAETLLAYGYTKHAFVDGGGRVVRPPKFLRQAVAALTGEAKEAP